jgi:hypothetical protein
MHLLTIHDYPHILDKTVEDLEGLRCRSPRLLLSKSIKPLDHHSDLVVNASVRKHFNKSLCVALQ